MCPRWNRLAREHRPTLVQLIISDACVGLVEAAAECDTKAQWQRCVVLWSDGHRGYVAGSSGCRCPVTRNLKFLSGQTLGSELSLSR